MERSKKSILELAGLVVAIAALALTWLGMQRGGLCETTPWMCIPAAVVSAPTVAAPAAGDKTEAKPGAVVS